MTSLITILQHERAIEKLAAVESGLKGLVELCQHEHKHATLALTGLEDLLFEAIEHFQATLLKDEATETERNPTD